MKHASLKLLPVCYPVYQAIAELNRSFEDAVHILDRLEGFNLFHRRSLQRCHLMLEEVRALTNHEMTEVMSDREMQNSAHFERLRLTSENRPRDPSDSLSDHGRHKESPRIPKSQKQRSAGRPVSRGQKAVRP